MSFHNRSTCAFIYCIGMIVSSVCPCKADFINLIGDKECLNCGLSDDEAKTRGWGQTTQGLQLSVSISNVTYLVGEPIVASVAVRNVANTDSVFPLSFPLSCFTLSVVRANGAAVPLTDYARRFLLGSGNVSTMKWGLGPNEALKLRYTLDKAYDLTKPSKYFVTARYLVFNSKSTNLVYVISNTVTVEVAAASSRELK